MALFTDVHHIHRAQLRGLQLDGIDVELDLPVLSAVGLGHRGAGNVGNLVANVELSLIVQLGFGQSLALQSHQANRHAGGVELQHDRRQRALRQPSQVSHRQVGDLADRRVRIGSRLEVNLDQADAGERSRLDVVDVAAQREEALEGVGDVAFDLLRRHAAVERGHHDDRNLDLRKQIDRHARHRGHADHDDDQAEHQNEERMLDGKTGHRPLLRSRSARCGKRFLLGLDQFARLIAAQVADDHSLAFVESAEDLDVVRALHAHLHLARLHPVLRVQHQHAGLVVSPR